jgi:hypothetical protein
MFTSAHFDYDKVIEIKTRNERQNTGTLLKLFER